MLRILLADVLQLDKKGRVIIMSKQINLKELLETKVENLNPIEDAQMAIEAVDSIIPKNLMLDAESILFKPDTKSVRTPGSRGLTVEEAKQFNDDMNRFIDSVLIAGVDYGVIPHCNKPTLLKPGAEKIMNYLGLIARTEVVNRVEDHNKAFFSYEIKVYLLDYDGLVRGEGVGLANTKEGKYAKQNGYSVQNVVLKMAKKRALVDSILNVGNLSARFTQDVEDLNIEQDSTESTTAEEHRNNNISSPHVSNNSPKPVSQKQILFIESLMDKKNVSVQSVNNFCSQEFNVTDYRMITAVMASSLIERLKATH